MTHWENKKLKELSIEDKFEMIESFAKVLGELYTVTKNDDKPNIVLIIRTLVDTFSAILLGSEYDINEKKVRDIELSLNDELTARA